MVGMSCLFLSLLTHIHTRTHPLSPLPPTLSHSQLLLEEASPTPARRVQTELTAQYGEPKDKKGHALLELINTELSYVDQLSMLLSVFRQGVCNIVSAHCGR